MSCADFTAMDAAGQAKALAGWPRTMASGGMMAAGGTMAMSPDDMRDGGGRRPAPSIRT